MQSGKIGSVSENEVEIHFDYKLYADTINQNKNRIMLEEVFDQVLKTKVRIKAVYAQKVADDTIAALTQNFGGTVV